MSNFCSLPRNPRWRRKGDYEWQIWISIYEVKATVLSLLSCIFVMLDSQRLRLDMFRLFPSSKPQLTTPENTITYHNTVFVGLCIGIVFRFSRELKWPQEKLKTMLMLNCGVTNKQYYGTIWRKITTDMYATYAVAKRKPEKNSGLYGIRTLDLCDTGAALFFFQAIFSQLHKLRI